MRTMRILYGAVAVMLIALGALSSGGPPDEAPRDVPVPPSSDPVTDPSSADEAAGEASDSETVGPPAPRAPVPMPDVPREPVPVPDAPPEPDRQADLDLPDEPVSAASPPSWTAIVRPGQTLDGLLGDAGFDAGAKVGIAAALAAEYDVRGLRPGHRLTVAYGAGGEPEALSLAVDDGVRIEVELADSPVGRTVVPELVAFDEARELSVAGSLYATLGEADVPTTFAVEIARLLRATIDVRRALRGGERLRVLWSRLERDDGAAAGRPRLSYAALDVAGDRFEIVRTGTGRGRTTLYVNGAVARSFVDPVEGGRLSSAFGPRKHPVYADMRLHAGVDFAAARGAPIAATAAGEVSFIGWRRGYGQVVELAHGADTMARYAHLSAVAAGLAIGDRVPAGTLIGEVGETGTATSPNLHYEVRVADSPVDPLGTVELASVERTAAAASELATTRSRFEAALEDIGTEWVAERS